MSLPKSRHGFFQRLAKNIEHIDKRTLLTQLVADSKNYENWLKIFDRLDEGVIITSADGEIEFVNQSAQNILGLPPSTPKPFWRGLNDVELSQFFEKQLLRLSSEMTQSIRLLSPREKNLKIHLHPQIFKNPIRHLICLVDLTEPLTQEVERLTRSRFESVIRLAGGLAHEIGNPLNAISLHSEILKKQIQKLSQPNRGKLTETVQIIQDEIHRLDRIVRNFLKTTRRAPLRFQMINLCSVISDVLRVLKPALEEHDIQLELNLPEKVDFFLDEERIRSMFINLIQNAVEAMMDGGKLIIEVKTQAAVVQIQIRDNGRGIASQDLPHIFEAYFTTKDHGSGLGLLFVYDVVTDHGGKIQVESKLGKGTRFEILLPLRRSNLQIKHTLPHSEGDKDHA